MLFKNSFSSIKANEPIDIQHHATIIMMTNKIKKVQQSEKDVYPFQNEQDIGLFTFYLEQQKERPSYASNEKVLTPQHQEQRQLFTKKHSQRIKTTSETLQDSLLTSPKKNEPKIQGGPRIQLKRVNKKIKDSLPNVLDLSFVHHSQRKNAQRKGHFSRYETEPKKHQPVPSEYLHSVNLTPLKQATSQEIKELFLPKKHALNKFISSSLTGQKVNSQQEQAKDFVCPEAKQHDRAGPDYLNYRPKELNFLQFLYEQKNLLSQKFIKRRNNKKIEELMDLKTKEIQLKRYRINNAPAMPHLSVSDRAKRQ